MTRFFTCLLLLLLTVAAISKAQPAFRIDSLPATGVLLDKGWKFHPGDNPDWEKSDFDDAKWQAINPALDIHDLPQVRQAQIGWFRLKLQVDSTIADQPLALVLSQVGASEIYLNGKLLQRYGTIRSSGEIEQTRYLRDQPVSLRLGRQPGQVLAVRYSFTASNFYVKLYNDNPCLRLVLQPTDDYDAGPVADRLLIRTQQCLLIGLFLLLGGFCLFLYFLFRTARFYLFLGLYCLGQFAQIGCQFGVTAVSSTTSASIIFTSSLFFSVLSVLAFLYGFYVLFQQPRRWFFYLIVAYAVLTIPLLLWSYKWGGIFSSCFYLVLNLDTLRLSFQAARRRRPGAWILFITILLFYLLFFAFVALGALDQARASYLTSFIALFVAPFGLSLFLAGEFARTSRSLQMRVVEVEALSEKTLAQEQEKQQMLATQNQTLEKQVIERTVELTAKNQELIVEAALEKVRSRSLAMQHSDELKEVITLVFQQLNQLNINLDGAAIISLYNENSRDCVHWTVNPNQTLEATFFKVPYFNHPFLNAIWEAVEKGEDFTNQILTLDEKKSWLDGLFMHTDYQYLPEEIKQFMYETESYALSIAFEKNSLLMLDSYSGKIYSEQDIDILKRFARVFDQAYTRFLDLQKAEKQAREAQIDAALEKVRTQSMAMQQSDHLQQVIQEINQQLQALAVPFDLVNFAVIDTTIDDGYHTYNGIPYQSTITHFYVPYLDHKLFHQVRDILQQGLDFYTYTLTYEEKNAFYKHCFEHTLLKELPQERKQYLYDAKGMAASVVFLNKNVFLNLINYQVIPYTDEQNAIFKRFGTVFGQAFTRFLDIQKAELQAREAQIEAALERVRSRSLAMQHSNELQEVITLVFHQFNQVHITIDGAAIIGLYTENAREAMHWVVNPGQTLEATCFKFPYFDHPFVNANYEAAAKGVDFVTQSMSFDEKNGYFKELFTHTDYRYLPDYIKQIMYKAESYTLYIAFEKYTCLMLDSYSGKIYSEQEIGILKRFARVFDQAYTRFLDIQKAEAQAHEAVRTASLDRVRAQIASMRTTQDLSRIPPLIWNELTALGVPFIRCGVFIMDEDQQQIHTFLSTPDGKAIASFTTPFANPGLLAQALPHWRAKQIYQTHWDEASLLAQAQTLISQGVIATPEVYLTENHPTSLYLHLLPFLQGMLYVGNDTSALTDDQLSVVQTLADAFSTAYARYEDFTRLEAAKKLAESTLTELKVTQTQLIQKEKMASLGELTAGIAHEIQNPLNFVNNFSEVSSELVDELKEGPLQQLPKTEKEYVEEILGDLTQNLQKITYHGNRASAIIKGMLEHSRTRAGERQSTDLNALADEYLRLAYQGWRTKDKAFQCALITEFTPDLSLVEVVPQEIGRVLLNLYNNAFYAVQQRQKQTNTDGSYVPTVWVSSHQRVNGVEIRVKDNGIGVPDSVKAKIFQPFFTTKPTGEGTGLGLSLSYDIVTKGHGGQVTVKSQEGQGTEFAIYLPAE